MSLALWQKWAAMTPMADRDVPVMIATAPTIAPAISRSPGGWRRLALALAGIAASIAAPPASAGTAEFADWLAALRAEAREAGIREVTLDAALAGLAPLDRVIELDRRQPEFTQTFWSYLDRRITSERIARGRELLGRHRPLLERVRRRFGVQPRFLVAFWALESNFGRHTGAFPVIAALATLAYDGRRGPFFRDQLHAALLIMDRGDIGVAAKGSWAGAMGQVQFMPTTYRDFAVDFDDDRRRDLWRSLPDVFASAANYLARAGWRGDKTWGREVRLPPGFDAGEAGLEISRSLAEWQRLGVRRADGRDLPRVAIDGSIVLPGGHGGAAFMVYDNFRKIMVWNRSILYALSVGLLSDRLIGKGPPLAARPDNDRPLSRAQMMEIQELLAARGLDPGTPDGIAGARTRGAIKAFQRAGRLPPDGFPSVALLESLRTAAGRR